MGVKEIFGGRQACVSDGNFVKKEHPYAGCFSQIDVQTHRIPVDQEGKPKIQYLEFKSSDLVDMDEIIQNLPFQDRRIWIINFKKEFDDHSLLLPVYGLNMIQPTHESNTKAISECLIPDTTTGTTKLWYYTNN